MNKKVKDSKQVNIRTYYETLLKASRDLCTALIYEQNFLMTQNTKHTSNIVNTNKRVS